MEWLPIDSAPKDGTIVDVWVREHWSQHRNRDGSPSKHGETIPARRHPDARFVESMADFYGEVRPGWCIYRDFLLAKDQVTHWSPSPGTPEEDDTWQPIETAPKDGTAIDLWIKPHVVKVKDQFGNETGEEAEIEARREHCAYWIDNGYLETGEFGAGWAAFKMMVIPPENVTHWRPILAEPQPE